MNNLIKIDRITLKFKLYAKNVIERDGGYINILSKTFDFCSFLNNPASDDFFIEVLNRLWTEEQHNIFKNCPIEPVIQIYFLFFFFQNK